MCVVVALFQYHYTLYVKLVQFLTDVPEEIGAEVELEKQLDINQVLPANTDFAYYQGSFTTPPCTEGVQWLVCLDRMKASPAQIEVLKNIEGENNRPTQAVNRREVEKF